jgi:hypothetical protein
MWNCTENLPPAIGNPTCSQTSSLLPLWLVKSWLSSLDLTFSASSYTNFYIKLARSFSSRFVKCTLTAVLEHMSKSLSKIAQNPHKFTQLKKHIDTKCIFTYCLSTCCKKTLLQSMTEGRCNAWEKLHERLFSGFSGRFGK